jgi:hypothetical protein
MPPLPVILFAVLFGLVAIYAAAALAKDVAVLFLRAVGHLPRPASYGAERSGKWPALERNWLKVHPCCAGCGTTEQVSVHHKRPFHLHPDLELDSGNLISLCEKHNCHLMLGHSGDWHAYNPHVEEDAKFLARRVQQRKYE